MIRRNLRNRRRPRTFGPSAPYRERASAGPVNRESRDPRFAELDAAIAEENRRARRSGRDPYNEFGAEPGPLLPSGSRTTEAPEREGGLVSQEPAARVRGAGA